MSAERSVNAPAFHDDTWIEQWAAVYLDPHMNRVLRAHRVRFEAFLMAPVEILAAVQKPQVIVSRAGLLPAQRAVQMSIDVQAAIVELAERAIAQMEKEGACCSNGRMTQKLRHKAHPRGAARFGPVKEMV